MAEAPLFVASFEGRIYRQRFASKEEAEAAIVGDLVRRGVVFALVWEGEGDNKEMVFLNSHIENFGNRLMLCHEGQNSYDRCLDEFTSDISRLPLRGVGLDQIAEFLDADCPWDIAEL